MGNRVREASYEEIPIFFGLLPTGGMWCKHHGDLWFKLYSVLCITAWKAGQELSQERLGDSWDFFFYISEHHGDPWYKNYSVLCT